ncbi:unnamed protein product [Ectocarpus sp. 12 AP-2014]
MAYVINDFTDIMNGVYGRNAVDVKKGLNKTDGYIMGADSNKLEKLMEILAWFSEWEGQAHYASGATNWQEKFITWQSWTDMRATILGFVAMSRYIFSDHDLVAPASGPKCYLYPRVFSQDIREHRFAHIRQAMGCHKNPTKELAFEAGRVGDLVRFLHGSHGRRNASRVNDFFRLPDLCGHSARASLPISAPERANEFRSPTCDEASHVLEARSVLTEFGPEWQAVHVRSVVVGVPPDAPVAAAASS